MRGPPAAEAQSVSAAAAAPADEHRADETRLYSLLLISVIASLGLQGAIAPGAVQQVLVSALLGASLLLAFRVARLSRPLFAFAVALAVTGIAVSVLRAGSEAVGDGEARAMNALLALLGPPAVALGVLRNLRASRQVRIEAVMGVLSLYILLGLLFGFVYGAIDRYGDPFFADGTAATVSRCLYFSFTTLTTVGYGDFVAGTDLGHTLAVFEALIGQIYLVTVVALIVGNLGRPDRAGRS